MTSSRKQKTREGLLEAAWERLERGDAAKLEEVGADVGVSRQTVYLHFGSRGGMLLALVDYIDRKNNLPERVAAFQKERDPLKLLSATLTFTASYGSEIQGVTSALLRLADHDEDVRAALEDRMQRRREGLSFAVSRIAKAGLLRKEWSAKEVVDALWEASAPTSYRHLVVERDWKPTRYCDWLLWLAHSFVRESSLDGGEHGRAVPRDAPGS
jgi:AcrR family transcriptional regulator